MAQQDTGSSGSSGSSGASAGGSTGGGTPIATSSTQEESATDVVEKKGESYYFLGANYRVNLVPAFLINLFVNEGPNLVATSTVGLSFDYRKDHFSLVPGINFTEYGFDPVLFLQKGKDPADPGDWGVVHSTLKGVYVTIDLLWSVPLLKTGQWDFEFGFSAGLGAIFGDLYNTWVTNTPIGGATTFKSQDGTLFYQCTQPSAVNAVAPGDGTFPQGCNTGNHQNATISKTGPGPGHREPNWFDSPGGAIPTVFPWLSLPILGFRIKPIKQIEMRLNGGFSVTGFFFNFAAYYGFESTSKSSSSSSH